MAKAKKVTQVALSYQQQIAAIAEDMTPLEKVELILGAMSEFDEGPFSAEIKRHMSKADNHMQEVAAILENAGL